MKHVPLSRDQAESLVALIRSNYPEPVSREAYIAQGRTGECSFEKTTSPDYGIETNDEF